MNTNEKVVLDSKEVDEKWCYTEETRFFTKKEVTYFSKKWDDIVLRKTNDNIPYLNYEKAKEIFESVVGNSYDMQIISEEFVPIFNVYKVLLRVVMYKGDKKVFKDMIGCANPIYLKGTEKTVENITNFSNMPKTAIKDAFKKFLLDYIGIGYSQYQEAKKVAIKLSNEYGNASDSEKTKKCEECNYAIYDNVYDYSKKRFGKALCKICQKKSIK